MATTNQLGIPIAAGIIGDSIVKRDADGNFAANEITGNLFKVQYGSLSQTAISYDFSFIDADSTDYVKYGGIAVTNSSTTLGAENGLMQFQTIRNGSTVNWAAYLASNNKIYLGFSNTIVSVEGLPGNGLLALNIDKEMVMASGTYGISISGNAATATLASTVTTNANLIGPVTSAGNTTSVANSAITNAMLAGSITASKLVQTDIVLTESQVTNLVTDLAAKLNLSGGTMLGALTLNADAVTALQPVTLQQMNAALVGLWDDRGNYNASGNAYPSSGGSGTGGAILKGDIWTISVAGTLPTAQVVEPGDTVRALIDTPGQTQANWAIAQNNVGYTPLSNVLASTQIFVGNGSNVATGVAVSGAIAMTNTGVTSINNLYVTNAMIANTTIDLTAKVTGILPSANGGTNNAFFAVSGPATSAKTFTFPNVSATILTTNAAVTESQGGTNQSTYTLGDTLYSSAVNTLSKLPGNTSTTKQYLSQTGNGSASAAPVWAAIAGTDIAGAALTKTDDTNVTLTLGGTPATSLLRAASITVGWIGTLSSARGGVGLDSSAWAQGDLPYISATGVWNHLAKNTTATRYLANTGTTNNPAWAQIDLTNGVTGVLPNTNTTAATTNIVSTIVARDGSGNFSAGTITATLTGAATSAANIVGGALGSLPYQTASSTTSLLAGNITTTPQILTQVGNGSVSAAPTWTSAPTLTGLSITSTGAVFATIASTTTGSSNEGGLNLVRGDQANGYAQTHYKTLTVDKWATGLRTGDDKFHIYDVVNSIDTVVITGGTGTTSNMNLAGTLTVNAGFTLNAAAGSSSNAGSMGGFNSVGSPFASNLFGIQIQKVGTDILYMGVNKNTVTGSVPANACYISGFGSGSKLAIGRGDGTGLPSTADILLNGDGTVTFGSTITATSATFTGPSSGVFVDATATASGILNQITVANPSNTANSGSFFKASTAGASSGDALYQVVNVGTAQTYSWGLDNSVANDPFVFSCSGTLGTTNAYSIDSSANVTVNNNFASVGGYPAYQCRAWVNFNGTGTVAIRASGNVSSITDRGVGQYTVNLTNALVDANFSVNGMVQDTTNRAIVIDGGNTAASALTSSTAPIATVGASSSYTDMSVICVQIFR